MLKYMETNHNFRILYLGNFTMMVKLSGKQFFNVPHNLKVENHDKIVFW